MDNDFNLTISRDRAAELAPDLIDMVREFTGYGLCRQNNTVERKMLAEKFARLAQEAMRKFPDLKLNHAGAKTIITETKK